MPEYLRGLNELQKARIYHISSIMAKLRVDELIPALEEPVLDLGTGIGTGPAILKELGLCEIYGIDTNSNALEKAISDGRLDRTHAIKGDARKLREYLGRNRLEL